MQSAHGIDSPIVPMSGEEVLRRLAIGDPTLVPSFDMVELPDVLDARSTALLRLGALIAASTSQPLLRQCVSDTLDYGVTCDQIVGALIALAPTIGIARVTSVASDLASALGYDIDDALEHLDAPGERKEEGS